MSPDRLGCFRVFGYRVLETSHLGELGGLFAK